MSQSCPLIHRCPVYDMMKPLLMPSGKQDEEQWRKMSNFFGCSEVHPSDQYQGHDNCKMYKLLTKNGTDVYAMIKEADKKTEKESPAEGDVKDEIDGLGPAPPWPYD